MSAVIVSLRVTATPQQAFDVFVRDIGLWWRPNALFPLTQEGDGALRFDGQDRLVTTLPGGEIFEIGRVSVWSPGDRLAFTWRQSTFESGQTTYVEIRFEAVGAETRVTIEHRGWDKIPKDHLARHGFPLEAIQLRLAERWRDSLGGFEHFLTKNC